MYKFIYLVLICSIHSGLSSAATIKGSFHLDGFFYLPIEANDELINQGISAQIKFLLSAMRPHKISPNDLAPIDRGQDIVWKKVIQHVVDPNGFEAKKVQKINYRYRARAVADTDPGSAPIELILLNPNYAEYEEQLLAHCTDGFSAFLETLWYFFEPHRPSCRRLIEKEEADIATDNAVKPYDALTLAQVNKIFITTNLYFYKDADDRSLRYPRVFNAKGANKKLIVYVVTGADTSTRIVDDRFGREYLDFIRTMTDQYPGLKRIKTEPWTNPKEIVIDDMTLTDVTEKNLLDWLLDQRNYPAAIEDDLEKITLLRATAMDKFAQRSIHWQAPSLNIPALDRTIDLEIRSFYGHENGESHVKYIFMEKLREAFSQGHIVIYNGHSYHGYGSINPTNFAVRDFLNQNQLLFINSCNSYSFFSAGFLDRKLGANNVDLITNGSLSLIKNSGAVAARFLQGVLMFEDFGSIIHALELIGKAMRNLAD